MSEAEFLRPRRRKPETHCPGCKRDHGTDPETGIWCSVECMNARLGNARPKNVLTSNPESNAELENGTGKTPSPFFAFIGFRVRDQMTISELQCATRNIALRQIESGKVTVKLLAKKAAMSPPSISNFVHGKRNVSLPGLSRILTALDLGAELLPLQNALANRPRIS